MAVPITLPVDDRPVDAGKPVVLFSMRPQTQLVAALDGQRFLLLMPLEDASTPPITVVLNWKPRS
jgi:hypothetical protein